MMNKKPKLLFIGNVQKKGSKSMQIYLDYLKKLFPKADFLNPYSIANPKIYKNFIYPFIIPRNYDIYHIIDHSYAFLAHFLPKEKTIITCHDLIPLKLKKACTKKGRILFRYYISGLKKAKKIIADSENTKKDIINELNISSEKIEVIPALSIDRKIFRKLDKKKIKNKYNLSKNFVILSVGGFYYKNTLLILKALDKLRKEIPEIKLIKIGGFIKEEEDFINKKNLKKFILIKKRLSEKEIVEIYNLSDVLVFPSLYEGFGIPPLEAMACETPVISSNKASLPEIVGDAGIIINPYSVEQLISAIKKIKNNKSLKNDLIKKGIKNLERFNNKKIFKKLKKVYNEIAS